MNKSSSIAITFWVIILCLTIFLFVGTPSNDIAKADTDTAQTLTTIGNATPSVNIDSVETPITLTENGSSSTAWATTTITDNNGCDDLSSIVAVFFDDAVEAYDCSADGQNCYPSISCVSQSDCSGAGDLNETYVCSSSIWHYSNASSNWKWYIQAGDGTATGSATSSAVTINSLVALDVSEASISYGTLALGATSSEKSVTVSHTGNDSDLDTGIKESVTFTCDGGTIDPAQQHYSTTTSFAWGDGTALTTTTATLNTSLAQGSDATHTPTTSIYWLLVTPSSGVEGSCTGTNYFEAQ